MTGRLKGKVTLVTGAARGIGRAQAVRFAQEGADIIAMDICAPVHTTITPPATRDDLDQTAELVESYGRRVIPGVVDVRDLRAVERFTTDAATEFGGLDIVCATAGITSRAELPDMTESAWQTMIDINLTGVWHTTRAATPHLIARGGGSMVLVSSIAGLRGIGGISHYVAAKHGVVGLMRSLAAELAPHKIRVNTVHPTNVDTPMIQNEFVRKMFRPDLEEPTKEEFAQAAMTMNMLELPWVEPVDIANASLFLASDEARYITSVSLPVDAGSTQK